MPELEMRRIGRTEMRAMSLGVGGWPFGRPAVTDEEVVATVRKAIDLGLNFLDTSPAYGECQRRFGLALKGRYREKVYLETKTGTHPERSQDYSAEGTRWSVENSLRLLRTDYLDSVLIHDPRDIEDPLAPGHALDELVKMRAEGLIRHVGIGCRPPEFHKRAIEAGQIDIVLTHSHYTLLDQQAADTPFRLAKEHDIGLLLGAVLAVGALAGCEPEDRPKAHAMWKWCRDRGFSVRDFAMQFALAAPIDGIVLCGPENMKEFDEIYDSATKEIPAEIWGDFKAEFGVGL